MTPTWPGSLYRPVVLTSYALTYALVGNAPWLYHATNVAIHAVVVLLVYAVLGRVCGRALAFVAALLFAVHPIHVDAVAGVANRTDLMGAMFGLAALWCVLRADERVRETSAPATSRDARLGRAGEEGHRRVATWLAAAFALFLLALLSKESAVTLLAVAPCALWLSRRDDPALAWRARARRYVLPLLAMSAALAVYLWARWEVLGVVARGVPMSEVPFNPLLAIPTHERLLRATVLLGRYLALLFVPFRLSPDYSVGTPDLGDDLLSASSILGLGLVLGWLSLLVIGLRREPRLSFLAFWFLATFAVTANLVVPIGTIFGERLAYLPSAGAIGVLAWLLLRAPAGLRGAAVGLVAVAYAAATLSYAPVWRDNEALFRYAREVTPASARVQTAFAETLSSAGALAASRREFEISMARHPFFPDSHYGIAVIDLQQGRREEAVLGLQRTLALDRNHVPALLLLGRLWLREDRVDDAALLFVRVLNMNNSHFEAQLGILAALLERGSFGQAGQIRDALVAVDPEHLELVAMSREIDARASTGGSGSAHDAPLLVETAPAS